MSRPVHIPERGDVLPVAAEQRLGMPRPTTGMTTAVTTSRPYRRPVTNLKVISTAPDVSMRRKPSGSASGWRAATNSALALVVATASDKSSMADVSVSTGTPCLSHSTANITHLCTEDLGSCLNPAGASLVPHYRT